MTSPAHGTGNPSSDFAASGIVGTAAMAAALHALACAALVAADAGDVHAGTGAIAILGVAALAGAALLAVVAPSTPVPLRVAAVWMGLGLVHHYAVGIDARWAGEPAAGAAHIAWDVAFHLPPVVLALVATRVHST